MITHGTSSTELSSTVSDQKYPENPLSQSGAGSSTLSRSHASTGSAGIAVPSLKGSSPSSGSLPAGTGSSSKGSIILSTAGSATKSIPSQPFVSISGSAGSGSNALTSSNATSGQASKGPTAPGTTGQNSATPTASDVPSGTASPLPPGGTVVVATVSSKLASETFVPMTYSQFSSLTTTATLSTINAQSSPTSIIIGPGGVAWSAYDQSSGEPNLPPPTVLPLGAPIPLAPGSASQSRQSVQRSASAKTTSQGPSATPGTTASQNQPPLTQTQSSDAPLALIAISHDLQASKLSSVDPGITTNTAVRTSDGKHAPGLYPFSQGGPSCFFCPPGIDSGGLILWGMDTPGVCFYPQPLVCCFSLMLSDISAPGPSTIHRYH